MKNFILLSLGAMMVLGCKSPAPVLTTVSKSAAEAEKLPGYSILQGVSGPNWTRLNLVRNKAEELQYFVTRDDQTDRNFLNFKKTTHEMAGSDFVVDELELNDLAVGILYRFTIKDKAGATVDLRNFQSVEDKPYYNFAVVSCSDDFFKAEQKGMWTNLQAQNPEFILSIGDNVYADFKEGISAPIESGLALWNRYVETRQTLQLYRYKRLVPVAAIWDDHDYGKNNGDRRYKLKNESLKVFLSFFPQTKSQGKFVRGPGAASRWAVGGQAFLLLDNRSFRSPGLQSPACKAKPQAKACEVSPDNGGTDELAKKEPETHFGVEQERWAFSEVRKLHRPTWLVSGDQWFGAYHPFESYEGNHPNSFRKFVKEMGKSAFRVAFISGDRHSSELTRVPKKYLGYESFEVVSSPIHAKTFPSNWVEFPNSNQAFGTSEAMNFTIINSNIEKQAWKVRTANFKKENQPGFNAESLIWLNK